MTAVAGDIEAEVFVSGADITYATLRGTARRIDENIWAVELSSNKPKLRVRGTLHGNSFWGEYAYSRFLKRDRGRLELVKAQKVSIEILGAATATR